MSKKHGKKASVKYRKVTLEHKNLGRKVNQKYFQFLVLILLVVVALSGGTYAFLTSTKNGTKETEIVAGTLKVDYKDKNEINLTNTYPMSDSQGMNTGSYEFTITNEGTVQGKYEISLEEIEGNTLDKSNIRYSLKEGNGEWSTAKSLEEGLILKSNGLLGGESEVTC